MLLILDPVSSFGVLLLPTKRVLGVVLFALDRCEGVLGVFDFDERELIELRELVLDRLELRESAELTLRESLSSEEYDELSSDTEEMEDSSEDSPSLEMLPDNEGRFRFLARRRVSETLSMLSSRSETDEAADTDDDVEAVEDTLDARSFLRRELDDLECRLCPLCVR